MKSPLPGLVSIVIPAWNCASLLAKCLDSICDQSFREFEIIVVDNGSSDNTGDVARQYQSRLPVRVIRVDPNRGFTGGSNTGLNEVRGEFVLLLNSDVELHPEFLREGVKAFAIDERVGAAGGPVFDLLPTGRSDRPQSNGHYLSMSYRLRTIPRKRCTTAGGSSGRVGPPRCFGTAGLHDVRLANGEFFDERFWCNGEDIDMWVRLLHRGWTAVYVDRCICWHHGSMAFGGAQRLWQKSFEVQRIGVRNHYYVIGRYVSRAAHAL